MKKVILGVHTGRGEDRTIRYWYYDQDTIHFWNYEDSKYAIVDTRHGYQMVRILGIAEVNDEVMAEKRVISFLSNDNFPKEEQ